MIYCRGGRGGGVGGGGGGHVTPREELLWVDFYCSQLLL